MASETSARPQAESLPAQSFLERMAERLGLTATAKTIFADPVERDGITVIPVAKLRYGFGGGGGTDREQKTGSGGGGGVVVAPLGYIEVKQGQSEFKPIRDPLSFVPVVVAGGITGLFLLRGLRKLVRK